MNKLIEPKFKVGDRVVIKDGISVPVLITKVGKEFYKSSNDENSSVGFFMIKDQDDWELVPDKFDINTLVPFESKVLVKSTKVDIWKPAIFGCYVNKGSYYVLGGICWRYCIPYEGNEHLLGKNKDCDKFYQTWE